MSSISVGKFLLIAKIRNIKKNYKAVLTKLSMEVGFLIVVFIVASMVSQLPITGEQLVIAVYGLFSLIAVYFLFMPKLSVFTADLTHLEFMYMTPNYFLVVLTIKIFLVNLHLLIYSLVFMIIDLKIINMPEQFHWITFYCFLAFLANIAWIRSNLSRTKAVILQVMSIVAILLSALISDFLIIY